jgi:WD40 repeat protein
MRKFLRRSPRVEFTSFYIPYRNLNHHLLKPIIYTLEKPKGKPHPPRLHAWTRRSMFVLLALLQAGIIILFARDRLTPVKMPTAQELLQAVRDIPILDCGRVNRAASPNPINTFVEPTTANRNTLEAQSLALAAAAREANTRDQLEALALVVAANRIPNPPSLVQQALAEIAYPPGPVRQFEFEHPFGVAQDAAFSPDGQTVLIPYLDKPILWDVATGERLRVFSGHDAPDIQKYVTAVDFSPDGQRALSSAPDGTVILWDIATGAALRTLSHESQDIIDVAFRPDGRTAVSARLDGTLTLWNLETGEIVRSFTNNQYLNHFDLSPDGRTALTAEQSGNVIYWDVETGKPLLTLIGGFSGAVFSPNVYFAALWSWDTSFDLWDLRTGQNLLTFRRHTGSIEDIAFSPNGRTLLSASDDGTVILWDAARGEPIQTFRGTPTNVISVDFSPDGCTAISTGWDQTATLWDVHNGSSGQPLLTRESSPRGAGRPETVYSPDGRLSISVQNDNSLVLMNAETNERIHTFTRENDWPIYDVVFSPDGSMVLSADANWKVTLWDVEQGQAMWVFSPEELADSVAFSPDGHEAIAFGNSGTRYEWHIDTFDELLQWTLNNRAVRDLTCDERQRYGIEPLCETAPPDISTEEP